MKLYILSILTITLALSNNLCAQNYKSYRDRQKRSKYYDTNKQSLSDYCRECCKNPDPSAECKKLCGNCEMYNDEGKQGANNFPGN